VLDKAGDKKDAEKDAADASKLPPIDTGKGKRRVTIQVPIQEGDDAGTVKYPELRDYAASEHAFSSSRRISASRHKHALTNLEWVHQYEEEEGSIAEYLTLYHTRDNETIDQFNIVAQVSSSEEFAKSVAQYPKEWYATTNKYTDVTAAMAEDVDNAAAMLKTAEASNMAALQAKAATNQAIENLRSDIEAFKSNMQDRVTA
jgi:hypothetical protein